MVNNEQLAELLADWDEARDRGNSTTVEELCATCPDYREPLRESVADLQSMLQWLGETATFVESPRGPIEPPDVPGYEMERELGRGGMGVVFLARQVRANRRVALKMILSASLASSLERKRFRVEAESVAQLQHANIVQVFDVGEHAGGPYFALEYCPGGSLAKKLAGTPLSPIDAAFLVEKLAKAMAEAHAQGIVHRDLKPANVLLSSNGEPKISDFGLAKQTDAKTGERAGGEQTLSGSVLGTPSYMAPEQARGDIKQVGPASDIYALGAILYECLTGRPPFKGASLAETLDQVRNQEPVAPSQLNPAVPRDLETICLKCLRKEPTQRYASAGDLASDLIAFRENRPIQARPTGMFERGFRWCRRNQTVAVLLATVFVVLVAGTIVSTWQAVEARQSERKAQAAIEAMEKAKQRERETARRLVMFIKQNPAMIRERSTVIVAAFLASNADLTPDDVRDAFLTTASEAGTQSAGTMAPMMFGD